MPRLRIKDALSHSGAYELKDMIEGYWKRRGYAVTCKIVSLFVNEVKVGKRGREVLERFSAAVVTSDMVNGLPPSYEEERRKKLEAKIRTYDEKMT